jgi:hypothetical protein
MTSAKRHALEKVLVEMAEDGVIRVARIDEKGR